MRASRARSARPTNGNGDAGTSGPGSGGRGHERVRAEARATGPATGPARSSCRSVRTRLDPELVECARALAVGVERLGLTARAVERQHQLAARSARGADARRSSARARRRASAWRPSARSASIRSSTAARRRSSSRRDLDPCERLVLELGQRRPTPERQRLAQQARRSFGIGLPRACCDQPLETQQVELVRVDREHVPGRPRRQHAGRQHLSQPRDVHLHASRPPSPAGRLPTARRSGARAETTRFAFSSRSASSARCFAPPSGSGPSPGPDLQRPQ